MKSKSSAIRCLSMGWTPEIRLLYKKMDWAGAEKWAAACSSRMGRHDAPYGAHVACQAAATKRESATRPLSTCLARLRLLPAWGGSGCAFLTFP